MKKIFKNSYGKNTAIISCRNGKNKFNLYYHLSDNPVQHIWQDIHCANKKLKMGMHHGTSIEELVEKLQFYCDKVSVSIEPITQEYLNQLHHQFVLNSEKKDWQIINSLIHRIEDASREFSIFDSTLNFYSDPDFRYPIKEEYKLFLNNNCVWGQLLLGYGTLGKDWLDIFKDDDHIEDLTIQESISSETVMHFTAEQPFSLFQEQKFYLWAKSSEIDTPLNNLNKLALGRYHLGQIIITDVFLNFHNNPSDWYVPNHQCKLLWNQQFFTPDVVVEEINFENTDLFFNTLISHNNFDKLNA